MIVEPVPASGRSRGRRVAGALAVAAPVALLALVVATGVLGERPERSPGPSGRAGVASDAVASSAAVAPVETSPAGLPARAALPPEAVETIPVRTVESLVADAPPRGAVVAVSGFLAYGGITAGCRTTTDATEATFCERTAVLRAAQRGTPTLVGNRMAVVRLAVPPGVRLPRQALPPDAAPSEAGQAQVVVLVRRLGDGYRLDRVAWVEGFRWRAPSVDPALGRNPFDEGWWRRRLAAEAAMGLTARNGSVVMLVTAYVRLPALEAADATAARAVRAASVTRGPGAEALRAMWYVRARAG
jgi:hypothetical protein